MGPAGLGIQAVDLWPLDIPWPVCRQQQHRWSGWVSCLVGKFFQFWVLVFADALKEAGGGGLLSSHHRSKAGKEPDISAGASNGGGGCREVTPV